MSRRVSLQLYLGALKMTELERRTEADKEELFRSLYDTELAPFKNLHRCSVGFSFLCGEIRL